MRATCRVFIPRRVRESETRKERGDGGGTGKKLEKPREGVRWKERKCREIGTRARQQGWWRMYGRKPLASRSGPSLCGRMKLGR